tara:strand:+ start:25980 stop:26267 length:288 start_codon:yes stop_codon:yes gene_type:complete
MLFSEDLPLNLNLPDSEIVYYPKFLNNGEALQYFEIFKNNIPWLQDNITVYGKIYTQPRLTALFGNNGKPYSYSNITMQPHQFSNELLEVKLKLL